MYVIQYYTYLKSISGESNAPSIMELRDALLVSLFGLSPIRPGPYWSFTLQDADKAWFDTTG